MTKNLLSASTLLLLCSYIVPSAANSNMVSITHRSSLNGMANDYSSGLNVVKSTNSNNYCGHINQSNDDGTINYYYSNDEPEEYVTDFYRQKRIEKRELAAKAVGMEEANIISHDDCHSLDHYFDHDAIGVQSGQTGGYSSSSSGGDNDVKRRRRAFFRRSDINSKEYCSHELDDIDDINVKYNTQRPAFLPNGATNHHSRARVASSVRGGSITQQVLNQKQRGNHDDGSIKKNHRGHSRRNHQRRDSQPQKRPSATFAPRHNRHRGNSYAQYQRHDRTRQVSEVDKFNYSDSDTDDSNYEDEYDDHYDYISNHDEEYDDYEANSNNSMSPHQAGLLRVPCSLRLNSNENTHHNQHHFIKSNATPVAAYVDTGAQVTVISATAARRVGILHLMDRRYAGRATGVGHCRVLGRIPAGCVQFVLGNDDDCDYNDEGGTTTVQMNGPALTVLEGTVTEGVDMLLGLDVLQDWEATIQMGGSARKSSMTVKKRGMSEPVVLPFLVVGDDDDSSRGGDSGKDRRRSRSASSSSAPTTASHGRQQRHSHNRRRQQQRQQHSATKTHHHDDARHEDEVEDTADDDLFSPILWDIESDLDILDQSEFTHEFPDEGRRRRVKQCSEKIVHDIEREDELLGVRHSRNYLRNERDGEEEDDDDLLQDSSDDEGNDDEVTFDMSGL